MPMIRSLNQDFFKTWSPEMAYVLGYFAADGSMVKNNRGAHFIEFTSTDRILITHVQRATNSDHAVKSRERGGNTKTAYRLQIGSKEWFTDLTALGFTQKKSNLLQFPKIPKKFFADFVRGYFDGDGCVYFKEHWSRWHKKKVWVFATRFTCGNKEFLSTLHSVLKSHAVTGGHLNYKKKGGYDLVFSRHDSLALYRLMYHTAGVSDIFLPRKREKLEEGIRVLGLE